MHSQQDTFFDNPDDNLESTLASDQLLKMVDSFDKKLVFDIKPGSLVEGTITRIGTDYIFVDIQTRNEAIMNKTEVENENKETVVKTGDTIKAYVVASNADEIILSKKPVSQTTDRQGLFKAFRNKLPVGGKVTGVSKDGLTVKIMGQRAFCPVSQIDMKFT